MTAKKKTAKKTSAPKGKKVTSTPAQTTDPYTQKFDSRSFLVVFERYITDLPVMVLDWFEPKCTSIKEAVNKAVKKAPDISSKFPGGQIKIAVYDTVDDFIQKKAPYGRWVYLQPAQIEPKPAEQASEDSPLSEQEPQYSQEELVDVSEEPEAELPPIETYV